MKTPFQIIKTLHLLSLDVVLGTMICAAVFWQLPLGNSKINIASILLLGSSTWIIYILDRIIDNKQSYAIISHRHLFHQQFKKPLLVFSLILLLINILLLFYIPKKILYRGIILLGCVLVYFIFLYLQKIKYSKEFFTALFYTWAVVGIQSDLTKENLVLVFHFGIIALLNLLLFSYFEVLQMVDNKNICSFFGKKRSKQFIDYFFIISFLGLFSSIFYLQNTYQKHVLYLEFLMQFILLILFAFAPFFKNNTHYRWLADAIFILPIVLLV